MRRHVIMVHQSFYHNKLLDLSQPAEADENAPAEEPNGIEVMEILLKLPWTSQMESNISIIVREMMLHSF